MERLRGRILVVDSDGDRRSRLCTALEARRLRPVSAESTQAAEAAIEPNPPTLVIASDQLIEGPSYPLLSRWHEAGLLAPALFLASAPPCSEVLHLECTGAVRVVDSGCDAGEIARVAEEIHVLVESGRAAQRHPVANSDRDPSGLNTVRGVHTLARAASRVDALIGTSVGPYRVTRLLGSGGMGSVYLGEHPVIGSRVAIKFLHESAASDSEAVSRFCDEARVTNRLSHENIVRILDLGVLPSGRHYFVMEYLDGTTLTRHAGRKALPRQAAIPVLLQICDALHAAHTQQVIHRDVKPDNIFILVRTRTFPLVKLVDFGVAKLRESDRSLRTAPGSIVGTPRYMSPEQCTARPVDPRSDVYSLGVIAFELATGKPPFEETDFQKALVAHLMKQPPDPRDIAPDVDDRFAAAILTALEKDPDNRFQDMARFATALQLVGESDGADARRTVSRPAPPTDDDDDALFRELWSHTPSDSAGPAVKARRWRMTGVATAFASAVAAVATIAAVLELRSPASPALERAEPEPAPVARLGPFVVVPPDGAERSDGHSLRRTRLGQGAWLTMRSEPSGRVAIDGADTGLTTPVLGFELAPGPHRVVIRDEAGRRVEFLVDLRAGEERLEERLLK